MALVEAISERPEGAVLSVIVTPRSGKTVISGVEGDVVRVRVAAPPVDGAANAALVKFLAGVAGVPRSTVEVLAGQSGRRKRIWFAGMSAEELARRLGEGGVGE